MTTVTCVHHAVFCSFLPWVSIGQVADLDAFVEANVTTVADWDANFKMLKVKRRDSEKLPDFQKVDCVTVSLVPFKSSVEDQMQACGGFALMLACLRQDSQVSSCRFYQLCCVCFTCLIFMCECGRTRGLLLLCG